MNKKIEFSIPLWVIFILLITISILTSIFIINKLIKTDSSQSLEYNAIEFIGRLEPTLLEYYIEDESYGKDGSCVISKEKIICTSNQIINNTFEKDIFGIVTYEDLTIVSAELIFPEISNEYIQYNYNNGQSKYTIKDTNE